jgi:hypothetical protein
VNNEILDQTNEITPAGTMVSRDVDGWELPPQVEAPVPWDEGETDPELLPGNVKIAFPRPLPDPFAGGKLDLAHLLGEDFVPRVRAELERVEAKVGRIGRGWSMRAAEARDLAERATVLRNVADDRSPDGHRDAREVANIRLKNFFAAGGTLDDLERAGRDQCTQTLRQLAITLRERKGQMFMGHHVKGLEEKTVDGDVDLFEAAARLRAIREESRILLDARDRIKAAVDDIRPAIVGRCRRYIDQFGRADLGRRHREALSLLGLFNTGADQELDQFQAVLDRAAADYARLKAPLDAEAGPLEEQARAARDAALEAYEERKSAIEAGALARVAASVDRAAEGDYRELVSIARKVPKAYPPGFVEGLIALEEEAAFSGDINALALLLA